MLLKSFLTLGAMSLTQIHACCWSWANTNTIDEFAHAPSQITTADIAVTHDKAINVETCDNSSDIFSDNGFHEESAIKSTDILLDDSSSIRQNTQDGDFQQDHDSDMSAEDSSQEQGSLLGLNFESASQTNLICFDLDSTTDDQEKTVKSTDATIGSPTDKTLLSVQTNISDDAQSAPNSDISDIIIQNSAQSSDTEH